MKLSVWFVSKGKLQQLHISKKRKDIDSLNIPGQVHQVGTQKQSGVLLMGMRSSLKQDHLPPVKTNYHEEKLA